MSKPKLNGSVDLLAQALRGVISESLEETRKEIKNDIKEMETALISAVSDDLDKHSEKTTSEMQLLWENTQKQIAQGFAKQR